jgi:hypothetical protein
MSKVFQMPAYEGVTDYAPHRWHHKAATVRGVPGAGVGAAGVMALVTSWPLTEGQQEQLLGDLEQALSYYACDKALQGRHAALVSHKRDFDAALLAVGKLSATRDKPISFNKWGAKLVHAFESGALPIDAFADAGLMMQITLDDLGDRRGDIDAHIAVLDNELRRAAARSQSKHGRGPAPDTARYRLVAGIGRALRNVGITPNRTRDATDSGAATGARWATLAKCVLVAECGEVGHDMAMLLEGASHFL